MIEYMVYQLMQKLGYRKLYFDLAFIRSIPLDGYSMWSYLPKWEKGTYREVSSGWKLAGYGVEY